MLEEQVDEPLRADLDVTDPGETRQQLLLIDELSVLDPKPVERARLQFDASMAGRGAPRSASLEYDRDPPAADDAPRHDGVTAFGPIRGGRSSRLLQGHWSVAT